jgi:hypothetical protein
MERVYFLPLWGAPYVDGSWVGLICKFCDAFSCMFNRYITVGQVGQKEHSRTIELCHVNLSSSPPPPPTSPFGGNLHHRSCCHTGKRANDGVRTLASQILASDCSLLWLSFVFSHSTLPPLTSHWPDLLKRTQREQPSKRRSLQRLHPDLRLSLHSDRLQRRR